MDNLRWDETKPIKGLDLKMRFNAPVHVSGECPENTVYLLPKNTGEYFGLASFLISLYKFVAAREVLLALGRRSAVIYNIGVD